MEVASEIRRWGKGTRGRRFWIEDGGEVEELN